MSLALTGPCSRASTRQLAAVSRSFSTSPTILRDVVPPESPSYIRLPKPPQSEEKKPERVRGHLPVPREVFPRIEGDRKVRPEYLAKTVPHRASDAAPQNETQRWKLKMAATRRKNLEEGLHQLWKRRERSDKARSDRVSRKFWAHHEAGKAPEREDDRLTRSTVLDAMLDTRVYADPHRFERAEKSAQRVARREEEKRTSRQDALMELYMNAGNFIVNEQELKAEIETIFAEDYWKTQGSAVGRYVTAENAWDIWGKPPGINAMLETTTGTSTKIMDVYESEYDRSVKRQKRIAEEFTGGKME